MQLIKCVITILGLTFVLNADVLVMKNGDRVTGSVVKKDGKTVTVKTANFGTVSAPWDQVESITVDQPITVVLGDGRTVQAPIAASGGKLQISGTSVDPADVAAIRDAGEQRSYERLLHPGLLDLYAGTVNFALAGTAGNAKTQTTTLGFDAARVTRTDKTTVYFKTIKASALVNNKTADTAEAIRAGLGYSRNIRARLFANVFNDYEYDKFQNLDLRFVIGGGLGYHAANSDRHKLDVLGGGSFNRESFDTPLVRRAGELYFGDDYNLKLNAATSVVQNFRLFSNASDFGRYRVNFDIGANTRIFRGLTWNVTLSDRYLSRPVQGRKTNDFLYATGVGFTFAH